MTFDQNENPSPEADATAEPNEIEPINESEDSGEFAAMLEADGANAPSDGKIGDQVTGTIVQVGEIDAFVDCGLRNELPIALSEITGDDGKLACEIGDEVTAHIAKGNDGLVLTRALNLRNAGADALRQAFASETPLEGKVGETN